MYEISDPATRATKATGRTRSWDFINQYISDPITAASPRRSNVESRSAPHVLVPVGDIRASVPSSKSVKTNAVITIVPAKRCPDENRKTDETVVPMAPKMVIELAVTPILSRTRLNGVINRVIGGRNEP